MFIGSYEYSIDAKGRVSIPAKLRKYLKPEANNTFFMVRGTEQNIDLYPMDVWNKLAQERLANLNQFNSKQMGFLRRFLQEASEDTLDSQHRLTLPKRLIEVAEIDKEVFILGALNKIELWNPKIYKKYTDSQGKTFNEIAEEVMKDRKEKEGE